MAIVYPNRAGRRHRRVRAQEGHAAGRREGDDDRHAAARDRPDRAGDAGELGRHDHRRLLASPTACRSRGRSTRSTTRSRCSRRRSARSSPRARTRAETCRSGPTASRRRWSTCRSPQSTLYLKKGLQYGTTVATMLERLRGDRLGGDARDREDHEHDPVQQDQLRDDQRRVQEPSRARCPRRRRTSPAARCRRASRPPAETRPSSTTTPARGKWKAASGWLKPPGAGRRRRQTQRWARRLAGPTAGED